MKTNSFRKTGVKAAVVLLATLALLILFVPTVSSQMLGDVSFDGSVNILDVILVQRNILGMQHLTPAQRTAADVNSDGHVTIVDANLIMQYAQGYINSFPTQQLYAPLLISPMDNIVIEGSAVTFQWGAVSGATRYRLELTKVSDGTIFRTVEVDNDTHTTLNIFANDGTQYRWRVRAGNSSDWSSWSAFRIFNNGSLPSIPSLMSPSGGTIMTGSSVSFQWYPSSGANKYELLITRDSDGSEFRRQLVGNLTANTQTGFPNDGSIFRWKIRAGNTAGWSDWSVERLFTNSGAVDTLALLSPAANENVFGSAITFSWRFTPGVTRYMVEIEEVLSGGSTRLFKRHELGNVTSVTYYDFPNNGSQFKWRVRSGNVSTWNDNWSSYRTFYNGLLPSQVSLMAPVNGAKESGSSVNFQWNASTVAGTNKYNLQVMRVRDGLIVKNEMLSNVTASTQTGFPGDGTLYQWRVRAGTKDGWGDWSGFYTFTSGGLNQPILLFPLADGSVESAWVTFEWKPVVGATKYKLIIKDDDGNYIANETLGFVHAYRQRNFPNNGTVYTWSVQAGNREGWGPAPTNDRTFTNGTPYAAPIQHTPGADADVLLSPAGSVYEVSFEWSAVSGAEEYQLQVVAAKNNQLFIDKPLGNVKKSDETGFENGEQYKWRVRAGKDSVWGTWSAYRNFIGYTTLPTLPAPLLLSPAEFATASGTTVNFRWTTVGGAAKYGLEVINPVNGNMVFSDYNIASPAASVYEVSRSVPTFTDNSTQFMWRARANDDRWTLYRTFSNGGPWWFVF